MIDPWSVLTPKQAEVARRFLADREHEHRHLVVYLSGAHAYGFPSPDSDLDLKCVHIARTSDLVGLTPSDDLRDIMDVIDGVELDYGSNELAAVLRGADSQRASSAHSTRSQPRNERSISSARPPPVATSSRTARSSRT